MLTPYIHCAEKGTDGNWQGETEHECRDERSPRPARAKTMLNAGKAGYDLRETKNKKSEKASNTKNSVHSVSPDA